MPWLVVTVEHLHQHHLSTDWCLFYLIFNSALQDTKIIIPHSPTWVTFQGDRHPPQGNNLWWILNKASSYIIVYTDQWTMWCESINVWVLGCVAAFAPPPAGTKTWLLRVDPYHLCQQWRAHQGWRSRSYKFGWTGRNSQRPPPPPSRCCHTSFPRWRWLCRTSPWRPVNTHWCHSPGCAQWPWWRQNIQVSQKYMRVLFIWGRTRKKSFKGFWFLVCFMFTLTYYKYIEE